MDKDTIPVPLCILLVEDNQHDRAAFRRALQKSEKEKEAVLNSMSKLVAYLDREHRVLWANRAAGESVGLPPEDLAGRYCYDVWHGREKPCDACPAVKACETGQAEGIELVSPDGRAWFIRADPVRSEDGDVAGVVEVILEITDRKRAEEELRQRNVELKNFAYIVSHDLKNPIAFVQGYSSVLMDNYQHQLDERGRMDALVSDLLALSKVGQVVSTFEDVSAS